MNHKKCGFKDRLKLCHFVAEDCNSEECDFFKIPFTSKGIKNTVRFERKEVKRLTEEMRKMKKCAEHKENPEKYQELKKLRRDKVLGMMKLAEAFMYCKRTKL